MKLQNSVSDPKNFWRTINELAGRKTKKDIFPLEQYIGDRNLSRDLDVRKQIANEFNIYFSQVGNNLAQAINTSGPKVVNDADYTVNSTFTLSTVTEHDLLRHIHSLRGGSAPGHDCISASFLKAHANVLLKPLLHVINISLQTGEFPEPFKIAKVIPIYKSNDITEKSNFRPISLLSTLTKVIEKIVKEQFILYLDTNDIIVSNQYGFRKSKNISDALFHLNRDINSSITNNHRCLIVFLDLAKAFDTVDRSILISKMEHIGVTGNALNWMKSYFDSRQQFVNINGVNSDQLPVDYGVIQGSTLGPLLFLIYINNISRIRISGKLYLFADDSAILFEGKNWREVFDKTANDLAVLKTWFDQNVLTLNVTKTKYMPIYLRNRNDMMDLTLKLHTCGNTRNINCRCQAIGQVDEYKYLGVMFDSKMTWERHIKYLNSKLRKMTYAFKQLGEILDTREIKMAYHAYVQSVLESGIIAWGGTYKTNLQPLLITQKAVLKASLGKGRRYPTDLIFSDLKVLDIRQLYVRVLLTYLYKNADNVFDTITHNYCTRSAENIGIRTPRISRIYSTTNSYVIANYLYHNIPQYLRLTNNYTLPNYKVELTKWLLALGRDNTELLITSNYRC